MNTEALKKLKLEAKCCGITLQRYVGRRIELGKQAILLTNMSFVRMPTAKGGDGTSGRETSPPNS